MAFESNTQLSFVNRTSGNSVPFANRCRTESSGNTCDPNTLRMRESWSCVNPDSPNVCLSGRSIRKRSLECLDAEIKKLLCEKLVRRVADGKPFETIGFHRKQLIKQVVDWIDSSHHESNDHYAHKLVGLFARDLKQIKDVPTDNSEWVKLLNRWLRATSPSVDRRVYRILAVDGFRGFRPRHLKSYLQNVLSLPLNESHVCGVRKMYGYFDGDPNVCCLDGSDSACVVFLTLMDFYARRMKDDLMLDDQVRFRVKRTRSWVEGNLQQRVEYFRDIKNVNERLMKTLSDIYAEQFGEDEESLKMMGRELLSNLNCDDLN